jgi:hypothetical protein
MKYYERTNIHAAAAAFGLVALLTGTFQIMSIWKAKYAELHC